MPNALRVQWTVNPKVAPQIWLACNRCSRVRLLRSSGKIRLNANGKRLDAWLVYRCTACDQTWNRRLFQRRSVHDIDPLTLHALQTNDPAWVRRLEFDVGDLRRQGRRVEESADIDVQKKIVASDAPPWSEIDIVLEVPVPTCVRLDRLLASELLLSRPRIRNLETKGSLSISQGGGEGLGRRVRNGTRVRLDLSAEIDRLDVLQLAGGIDPEK